MSDEKQCNRQMIRFGRIQFRHLNINLNREKIIDGLIGSIVIFENGRIIINFNYRDEPVEATSDDIISAEK